MTYLEFFMAYSGNYYPSNPAKYKGKVDRIVYRSSWERLLFAWCDECPDVKFWSSEETVVPYVCSTDNKVHRYFVDCVVEFHSGRKLLIEVKPKCQTVKPVMKKGKKQRTFLMEAFTYTKNVSKWNAAQKYAEKHNMSFQIWTEDTLRNLGIKV